MILDTLKNAEKYYSLHPKFKPAFEYLMKLNEKNIIPGEYEISGRDVYAIIVKSDKQEIAYIDLEVHREYIDIQYCLKGEFEIGWKSIDNCKNVSKEYNSEKDIKFFEDGYDFAFQLKESYFSILFPEDAHAPLPSSSELIKVIIKVKI